MTADEVVAWAQEFLDVEFTPEQAYMARMLFGPLSTPADETALTEVTR